MCNSCGSSRVALDFHNVLFMTNSISADQKLLQTELRDGLLQQNDCLSKILIQLASFASQRVFAEDIHDGEATLIPSLSRSSTLTESVVDRGLPPGDDRKKDNASPLAKGHCSLRESEKDTAIGVCVRAKHFSSISCELRCICICHKERRMRTPQALDCLIGTLFVGYSGLPIFMQECNQQSCRSRSRPLAYVNYVFPHWFLARMVSFVGTMHTSGPMAALRIQRTVPADAELFTFAKLGNTEGLADLFKSGRASPNDVHYLSGVTALHFAVAFQRFSVCRLLLQAGADPFLCSNRGGSSGADKAWSRIFSRSLPPEGERELRLMFSRSETMERRNFSVLHRIILGLCDKSLREELLASTAEVNAQDSLGRTPLSLAAEIGDADSVSLLLASGAEPSTTANSGSTALCYAARTSDPACVSLLIDAGANIRSKTDWNQTALHYAAAHSTDKRNAQLLLEAGADPNAVDRDGRTPLGFVPIPNHLEIAECLLNYGAHIRCLHHYMIDPLSLSIEAKRHRLVDLFINHGFDVNTPLSKNQTLLHMIATFGDERMMDLFKRVRLCGVDVDQRNADGFTALDVLRRRNDCSSKLLTAFSALIAQETHAPEDAQNKVDVWEDAVEAF